MRTWRSAGWRNRCTCGMLAPLALRFDFQLSIQSLNSNWWLSNAFWKRGIPKFICISVACVMYRIACLFTVLSSLTFLYEKTLTIEHSDEKVSCVTCYKRSQIWSPSKTYYCLKNKRWSIISIYVLTMDLLAKGDVIFTYFNTTF